MRPSAYPPTSKKGKVSITFHILKDGHITDMVLVEKSGDSAMDWAAYGSITASNPLPSLPAEFGCKYRYVDVSDAGVLHEFAEVKLAT